MSSKRTHARMQEGVEGLGPVVAWRGRMGGRLSVLLLLLKLLGVFLSALLMRRAQLKSRAAWVRLLQPARDAVSWSMLALPLFLCWRATRVISSVSGSPYQLAELLDSSD